MFFNAGSVNMSGSVINNVSGDQINHYNGPPPGGQPFSNWKQKQKPKPTWPPNNSSPGQTNSSSYGSSSPQGLSSHRTVEDARRDEASPPTESNFSTDSNWFLPSANKSNPGVNSTATSLPQSGSRFSSYRPWNSIDREPSIIHGSPLPVLRISLDQALTNAPEVSSSEEPEKWIQETTQDLRNIAQRLSELTSKVTLRDAIYASEAVIYPRFTFYVFAHLTLCSDDYMSLNKFNAYLKEWKEWDMYRRLQKHQLIRDTLLEFFQKCLKPPFGNHPENRVIRNLELLDATALSAHLAIFVSDDVEYKKVLTVARSLQSQDEMGKQDMHALVNLLQARLDLPMQAQSKARHLKCLIDLSRNARCYPVLKGVATKGDALGGGGFGDVYRGTINGGPDIALKVLRVYQNNKESLLKQFAHEAVLWRQLSHPNILPFYGVYEMDGPQNQLCLACPFMDNGNLTHFLSQPDNKTLGCIPLALDVALGIEYLHSEKIVHGDLKGLNILISKAGRACLADFGLAVARDEQRLQMSAVSTNKTTGTMRWQAPELFPDYSSFITVVETPRPNTFASDIYAFALVCYEMFSGHYPFHAISSDFMIVSLVQSNKRPERPTEFGTHRGLTDQVWGFMDTWWAQEPAQRGTAQDAVQKLRSLPDRPADQRPEDNFEISVMSQVVQTQANHPFATLVNGSKSQ